ncbi:phosphoenolpyruvate carboxylase [Vibrio metschnikovii]
MARLVVVVRRLCAAALLSQPPKSLKAGLRITEQGEMIRFKLGLPEVAINSLHLYASAGFRSESCYHLSEPKQEWRDLTGDPRHKSLVKRIERLPWRTGFCPLLPSSNP